MKVTVKQDEVKPVPVEVLADSIVAISDGVKKLRSGRLNDRALMLLIQHAAPNVGGRYNQGQVPMKHVRAVIEGMESLERVYLTPKKQKP